MQLLLGQTVDTSDGPFGKITDIIVDAQDWTVAHLIVRPFEDDRNSRLVPFWLVDADGPGLMIGLTKSYAMRLEMVPLVGLVSIAAESVVERSTVGQATDLASVDPIGDTTVIGNPVRSIDGEFAGRLCGFVVTNRHLDAVLVRNDELATGQLASVPMIDVDAIRERGVDLYITRARVDQLCAVSQITGRTPRQRRFERDTIHAARRLTMQPRHRAWPHRQTWR